VVVQEGAEVEAMAVKMAVETEGVMD